MYFKCVLMGTRGRQQLCSIGCSSQISTSSTVPHRIGPSGSTTTTNQAGLTQTQQMRVYELAARRNNTIYEWPSKWILS